MRKPYFRLNRKSAVRMGAVLSLTLCMALQTAGCSPAGKGAEQTTAAQTAGAAGDVAADKDKADDVQGAGKAAAEKAKAEAAQGAGKEEPDKDKADDAQGAGKVAADKGQAGTGQGVADQEQEGAGEAAADKAQADAGEAADKGEGDSGIEAQPGVPLKAGNKAPDFTAELIDGSSISLSDLKGKPVIINFWATWCGPCVREMPAFERLKEDFGDEIGIIAVNCGDDADTVKDFVDEYGYTFPVVLDGDYEVTMLYPSNSIPYTVVLDANGKITHVSTGAYDADTMYDRYKEALGL
ncbi:MAG: TlpA family protein disulfide reductase [Clostridiales bacterium]|nr:TlpA family protein disulfide reductase [Clostridiales bacterium]